MATPRKTRGEWRPVFEALYHGKDYRRLSVDGKLVLLTLKGLCGAIGMKVWPALAETLAELTGMPTPRAKAAVRELVKAEWIAHEDGIVWVVRGLDFEPQLSPDNANHQKFVENELAGLPTSPIVTRFRSRYAGFCHHEGLSDSHPDSHHQTPSGGLSRSTPQPQPQPHPAPLPQPQPQPTSDHRTRLVAAANKGIAAQFGEQPRPIRWDSPSTHAAAEQLAEAGVDFEFALRCVFTIASTKTPRDGRPPTSLKYFTDATIDAWHAQQAHRDADASPTPVLVGTTDDAFGDMLARIERGEFLPNG